MARNLWAIIGCLALALAIASCGLDPSDSDTKGRKSPPGGPPGDPDAVPRTGGNGRHGLDHTLAIFAITPERGTTLGGTDVLIIGFNFQRPDEVTSVAFDGVPALSFVIQSQNKILATTPPHAPGLVDVVLRNDAGLTATGHDFYEYVPPPPDCLALTPNSGPNTGGTPVTITTANFVDDFTVSPPQVFFDGAAATSVSPVDATTVVAVTPADPNPDPLGNRGVDVDVISASQQQSCSFPGGFIYIPPTTGPCALITPPQGDVAGGDTVFIANQSGCAWTPNTQVFFGQTPAQIVNISNSQIEVISPPGPTAGGYVDVLITGFDAAGGPCDCTVVDGFLYVIPGPTCVSLAPDYGDVGGGTTVTIVTSGFADDFTVDLPEVFFDTAQATSVTAIDATTLEVISPPDPAPDPTGYRRVDVIVTSTGVAETCVFQDGWAWVGVTGSQCMTLQPPYGPVGGGNDVTVISNGTCRWTPNTTVEFGGVPAKVTYVDEYTVIATVPAHQQPGLVDVLAIGIDQSSPGGTCRCLLVDGYEYR